MPAALATMAAGALACWTPGLLVHVVRRGGFRTSDEEIVALSAVLATAVALEVATLCRRPASGRIATSLLVLVGVWLLEPVFFFVGSTYESGGLQTADDWMALLQALAIFPVATPLCATIEGSLGALVFVTLWLLVSVLGGVAHRLLRRSPPISPSAFPVRHP